MVEAMKPCARTDYDEFRESAHIETSQNAPERARTSASVNSAQQSGDTESARPTPI